MPVYARYDLAFDHGEGAYLYATDGRRFLDFASGIAVTMLGHAHPHLVAELEAQVRKLWHVSNIFQIPEQARLAERLVAASFADTVFFCNSGAEAIEIGIKTIRKYHAEAGNPQKTRIICCEGAFHGRTMATISAGGQPKHTAGFGPLLEGFDHVAFRNMNEMRAAIGDETAGILVEPVQGESGIRPASAAYLEGLRAVCDEFGLLLFFDEVQSGAGRTGRLFAHQWTSIAPDLMAVAKGIGGGFPVGGLLATERAASGMTAGSHGSTFGGNQLAMAAANAVLDAMLEDGFLAHVERMAEHAWARLGKTVAAYPKVFSEVRGLGLMMGLKCEVPNTDMVLRLQEGGLLTVAAGDNVVRLAPPLIIEESHIEEAARIIEAACVGWDRKDG
jgi:acetylornithine/N-succinyldiaminopimelate aminotransferase